MRGAGDGAADEGAVVEPLETVWRVPDAVWGRVAVLIAKCTTRRLGRAASGRTGRKRSDERPAPDGVICRMRTGCRWGALPRREFGGGDDSSVHRASQRWVRCGLFEHLWAVLLLLLLLLECDELGGVDRRRQSADGAAGKARHAGGTPPGRTRRTGAGTARSEAR